MEKIILASGSPRRRELLTQVGIEYEVIPADIAEVITKSNPSEVVEELSRQKADAVHKSYKNRIVLAADTVVAFKGKILGKPEDENDAYLMLKMLSGNVHQVYTGVTIIGKNDEILTFSVCTDVEMYENSDERILEYISSQEPMDKAGAYGIQGLGAILVKQINGDYNNVVGLPVSKVYQELEKMM